MVLDLIEGLSNRLSAWVWRKRWSHRAAERVAANHQPQKLRKYRCGEV